MPRLVTGTRQVRALVEHPAARVMRAAFARAGATDPSDGLLDLSVVGGCVRDAVMGLDGSDDLDFCTSMSPDRVRETVAGTKGVGTAKAVGESFLVINLNVRHEPDARGRDRTKVEVAQWRGERYDGVSRRPDTVAARSLADDLARRDFTCNAMAVRLPPPGTPYDPSMLTDPYGGRDSIASRVMTCPSDPWEMLSDDPLRVVRALRFCSRYGFRPDDGLDEALRGSTELLRRRTPDGKAVVPAERLRAETDKVFDAAEGRPFAEFVSLVAEYELGDVMFPGLDADRAAGLGHERLSLPATKPGRVALLALASGTDLSAAARAQRFDNATVQQAELVRRTACAVSAPGMPETEARRAVRRNDDAVLDEASAAARAYAGREPPSMPALDAARSLAGAVRAAMPIDGNDVVAVLGRPGPAVGAVLAHAEERFLTDPSVGHDELLTEAIAAYRDEAPQQPPSAGPAGP